MCSEKRFFDHHVFRKTRFVPHNFRLDKVNVLQALGITHILHERDANPPLSLPSWWEETGIQYQSREIYGDLRTMVTQKEIKNESDYDPVFLLITPGMDDPSAYKHNPYRWHWIVRKDAYGNTILGKNGRPEVEPRYESASGHFF